MKDRPPRVSFQPSEGQHEFIEGIRKRHGIPKSTYLASLVKAEMEKSEDRLRPIFSIETSSPQSFSPSGSDSVSPSLHPVPFGTKIDDVEKVVSVNSEVKKLIRDGKIRRAKAWMPEATV